MSDSIYKVGDFVEVRPSPGALDQSPFYCRVIDIYPSPVNGDTLYRLDPPGWLAVNVLRAEEIVGRVPADLFTAQREADRATGKVWMWKLSL